MAKNVAATSRAGNRMREENPQHPVARYCVMAREKLKMTPTEMARRCGLSRTAWFHYESGAVIASTPVLLRVAKESGLSLGVISALDQNDPEVLALAVKIAHLPPEIKKLIARAFVEPAAANDRVEGAGFKAVKWE